MELRYLGFDQRVDARAYRFEIVKRGEAARHFIVTVEMALFLKHRVAIQEGPALSASKLAADLENAIDGEHQLTAGDLHAYAHARAAAEEARAAARRGPR
jgi:hypothetical protein